ncbi:phospholipase/Carboxylesterase [Acidithiobacillus ferrivorans SS3]|uniref:Phospholipase/Carboxylesterase n=1 Tax=Acidithiobacillus ferrivorans SS3 TaxID=743299 RepID=G0JU80_9PROT|nr:dienelactone hydrolase family protein [Acidithiobacillus ferrivorans]AEM47932.1 phospholipase/Carboxylesterase [Acidithiobacillus ferrivorans SS3]OFA16034.1 phospholipase [Acidithiobacillus ferrivorans]
MSLSHNVWPEGLLTRPGRDADAPCVVLLHGLGASMEDLAGVADLVDPEGRCRWVFPNAPVRPVRINGGRPMRAWYDIYGSDSHSAEDAEGLQDMAKRLSVLLDHEVGKGSSIILGGFSQGGAMSLYIALHTGYVTKAVLALSAYLPLRAQLSTATAKSPLIFLAHGQQDAVLPISYMEIAQQMMEVLGYKISAHRYPMDHTLCEDELLDLRTFLHTIADSQETIACQ